MVSRKRVKKIVFLVPYPFGRAPSQRFRFEHYFEALSKAGHRYRVQSFLNSRNWKYFYESGGFLQKAFALIAGFIKRFAVLFTIPFYEQVFIHREAAPVGPPVFEWIIAKVMRKKIIYDFDDAIWLTDKIHESGIEKIIRWRSKVKTICKWSYKVSCGNEYLCAYAQIFNINVIYNPTTIDTDGLHNPNFINSKKIEVVTIGWTGSHSTLKYLTEIEPVLSALEKKYSQVEILVIADQKPELALRSLKFLPWRKETESQDLAKIDIGIMPLPHDEWTKGKCGFKALQYMAMKIPAVVSPVGVNVTIVDHSVTGFHATTMQEWLLHLEELINHELLRKKMGEAGRQKVIDQFSVSSNTSTFLSLFS